MTKLSTLEETIGVASKMKDCLQKTCDVYERFPAIISREHATIRQHNLREIEVIAKEKVALGEEIDLYFAQLKALSEKLINIYEEKFRKRDTNAQPINISQCIDIFTEIGAFYKEAGFGGAVFEHVLNGFKEVFARFLQIKEKVQPLVEKNKYILNRLIFERQENFRFWQEVASLTMASYSKDGKQRPKGSSSILSVRA